MAQVQRKEQEYASYAFKTLPLSKEDGGGFLVYFPDLPGCMSSGKTVLEAAENGRDAVQTWIDFRRELGQKLPKPSFKVENKEHKVNFSDGSGVYFDPKPAISNSEEEKTREVEEALNKCWGF